MLVSLASVAGAQPKDDDWDSFRNDFHLRGVADSALPPKLEELWEYPTEYGVASTAAIKDGRVYVGTLGGELLCLDLKTGQKIWAARSIDNPDPDAFAPGFKSSPTVSGGVVYLGDEDGVFHAIDAETGRPKWTFQTNGEIISSASVVGDKVIFGSYDNSLYCLTAADGKKVWSYETDGYVNCSPAIDGNHTFVTGCDEHLRVINIDTGEQVTDMPLSTYLIASPALRDGILYFGTYASSVIAVDWRKQETVWTYKDETKEFPYHSSAALTEKLVVVGGRDKQIHGIDRASGRGVWTFATRGRVDGSPVIVGERVFCGSSDGNLYELDLKTGEERWQAKIGREVTASPAVGENHLVIGAEGSDEFIRCFGPKPGPQPAPKP
jgi:outer membrane protein assembly factor BamB